jgi:hypothetical protein
MGWGEPLPYKTQKLYKVTKWGGSSSNSSQPDERVEVDNLADANVISSKQKLYPGWHTPMLDIDVPMTVVPSSTPGHAHLYFPTVSAPWDSYVRLLDAMGEIGILEPGYVAVSKVRGNTSLRLPWVLK